MVALNSTKTSQLAGVRSAGKIPPGKSTGALMKLRKIVGVAVLIGIGICIGGMIADASSAGHYLKEWQTLISGLLAIFAAGIALSGTRAQIAQTERHRLDDTPARERRDLREPFVELTINPVDLHFP